MSTQYISCHDGHNITSAYYEIISNTCAKAHGKLSNEVPIIVFQIANLCEKGEEQLAPQETPCTNCVHSW